MAKPAPVAALLVLLHLAGCYGWPPSDAKLEVFNETDAPALVEVAVLGEDGRIVHQDAVSVGAGPTAMAEGKQVKVPAGTYRIEARAGDWSANETLPLGRSTPAVKVYVTPTGLDIGVSMV